MKDADFQEMLESVRQAGQIKRGELAPARRFEIHSHDVRAIRHRLHLSQEEFAFLIGVSVSTLQNWEQGRRNPEGPARALLKIAEQKPEVVLEALKG